MFTRENYKQRIWPLPASDLLYVGRATQKKLHGYGIKTIGELAMVDPRLLHEWFGKWGYILHSFSNGMDTSPVAELGDEYVINSVGNSTTTAQDRDWQDEIPT